MEFLIINSGSSSIKFSVYNENEKLILKGRFDRIGLLEGSFKIETSDGNTVLGSSQRFSNHTAAIELLIQWLLKEEITKDIVAIGHRIVLGGTRYTHPQLVDSEMIITLEHMIPLAPEHLPQAIEALKTFQKAFPSLPQIACFDTAFHRNMPRHAQIYALPRELWEEGIVHYGFHGLSYEYIMQDLMKHEKSNIAKECIIIAHLGNGASMAAIKNGVCVDTTMGFTPAGGLVMGSRSGDLDPGILIYLIRTKSLDASALNELINQKSGLLGVSGISSDMKDLLNRKENSLEAAEAIDLYCYQAQKFVGALSAAMGAIHRLVFTGGIGENSPEIRWKICQNLAFIGVELDEIQNAKGMKTISRTDSQVAVNTIKTNEELMITQHVKRVYRNYGNRI